MISGPALERGSHAFGEIELLLLDVRDRIASGSADVWPQLSGLEVQVAA